MKPSEMLSQKEFVYHTSELWGKDQENKVVCPICPRFTKRGKGCTMVEECKNHPISRTVTCVEKFTDPRGRWNVKAIRAKLLELGL